MTTHNLPQKLFSTFLEIYSISKARRLRCAIDWEFFFENLESFIQKKAKTHTHIFPWNFSLYKISRFPWDAGIPVTVITTNMIFLNNEITILFSVCLHSSQLFVYQVWCVFMQYSLVSRTLHFCLTAIPSTAMNHV